MNLFCGVVFHTLLLGCWSMNASVTEKVMTTESCKNLSKHITVIPGHMHADGMFNTIPSSNNLSISLNFENPNISYEFWRHNKGMSLGVYAEANQTFQATLTSGQCKVYLAIETESCPPGFQLNKHSNTCLCSYFRKDPFPIIQCDNATLSLKVMVGYCVKYEHSNLYYTRCPYLSEQETVFTPLEYKETNNSITFCSTVHRHESNFCRDCDQTHCVSVYSDTFQCINNTHKYWSAMLSYLAIEIIPVTVFFMFVLYFHIILTSPPVNGFIFFGQVATTPFEVVFLQLTLKVFLSYASEEMYLSRFLTGLVIYPYSFLNLDFYRIIDTRICLSGGLRVVDILALRYLSTLYPLFLLLIAYIIIELQAMNIRPVIWMLKVICFPCMRWRRVWKAKVSIIDTFAAYFLLSYCKLMYLSFLFLSYSKVEGPHNYKVLTTDPSIKYLSKDHIPFVILSLVVILVFGVFPPILLTFYQLKSCVSCLERLQLYRPGLQQFIQAFQGCYRDGTNGTGDRRFFAGLYFIFRLLTVLVYTLPINTCNILHFKEFVFVSFLFICAVSQPYKKSLYTFIDCFFFTVQLYISLLQFYIYVTLPELNDISRSFLLYIVFLYIPVIYIICCFVYWLFLCFKNRDSNRYLLLSNDDHVRDTSPERIKPRIPVPIDISPRPSITHTEVSITELSQEEDCSNSESNDRETSPLLKKREMKIFSQHAATMSQEYSAY